MARDDGGQITIRLEEDCGRLCTAAGQSSMVEPDSNRDASDHELRLIEAAFSDALRSNGDELSSHGRSVAADAEASFPGYSVVREIRRGAQGVVYEAVQNHTNRPVAIKVIHGAALAGRRARFEREVQILARLRHANIVTIHDSAMTEDRAFFVMDYIDGEALDLYVEHTERSTKEVLRLFADISEAVGVAHLQGVIHRDLKPSNIRIDREGRARVLDFGLAKLIEDVEAGDGESPAVLTNTGQFVGSLPWASPEQAVGGDDIDIRTDVYSLGVMMYQALTGLFPYKVTGSMRSVTETICLAEPKRPGSVRAGINDEVDTIVLKCLSKDRERRYQSAVELARDLRRYMRGEAIEAKRDSSWYFLRKTIKRHRVPVGTGLALFLLLITFTISISVLYRQAETQRDIAVGALASEAKARQLAETEANKAKRVEAFLSSMLLAADPFATEREVTVRDALDAAAAQLKIENINEAQVEASIRSALGVSYLGIGAYEEAESQIQRARELLEGDASSDRAELLKVQAHLVRVLHHRGRIDEAVSLAEATLEARRSLLGVDHTDTLTSAFDLALLRRSLGQLDKAEAEMREVLAKRRMVSGDDDRRTIEVVNGLAWIEKNQGRFADAEVLYREAYERYVKILGEDHPLTMTALNNLATAQQDQGNFADAESSYRKTLTVQQSVLGEEHPYTLSTINNLGNLLRDQGKLDEAELLLQQAFDARQRVLGKDHEATVTSSVNLALVLQRKGKLDEAESLLRDAVATRSAQLGEQHPDTLVALSNLATLLGQRGNWEAAEPIMHRVLDARLVMLGEQHPQSISAMNNYSAVLLRLERTEEAAVWGKRSWDTATKQLGPRHPHTLAFKINYAFCLSKEGRYDEAESLMIEGYNALRETVGKEHPLTDGAKHYLIDLYETMGRPQDAERLEHE